MDFSKEKQLSSAGNGGNQLLRYYIHQAEYRYGHYRICKTEKPLTQFRQLNQEKISSCLRMKKTHRSAGSPTN